MLFKDYFITMKIEVNILLTKGPWVLVYSKAFGTKKEALVEELRLKKLNRKSIETLIQNSKDKISVG